jgi:hypothetical protein
MVGDSTTLVIFLIFRSRDVATSHKMGGHKEFAMSPSCVEYTGNIPSRRVVLRGALAVGGGLCLPVVLLGCDAKKSGDLDNAAPASPPTGSADPNANTTAPPTAKKLPPASVQYQAQPKGDQKCSGCAHFIVESSTCKLVDGPISPEGWCSLWLKKA